LTVKTGKSLLILSRLAVLKKLVTIKLASERYEKALDRTSQKDQHDDSGLTLRYEQAANASKQTICSIS
jgi:hypothetical protein